MSCRKLKQQVYSQFPRVEHFYIGKRTTTTVSHRDFLEQEYITVQNLILRITGTLVWGRDSWIIWGMKEDSIWRSTEAGTTSGISYPTRMNVTKGVGVKIDIDTEHKRQHERQRQRQRQRHKHKQTETNNSCLNTRFHSTLSFHLQCVCKSAFSSCTTPFCLV